VKASKAVGSVYRDVNPEVERKAAERAATTKAVALKLREMKDRADSIIERWDMRGLVEATWREESDARLLDECKNFLSSYMPTYKGIPMTEYGLTGYPGADHDPFKDSGKDFGHLTIRFSGPRAIIADLSIIQSMEYYDFYHRVYQIAKALSKRREESDRRQFLNLKKKRRGGTP
jgi:hypothetical protein